MRQKLCENDFIKCTNCKTYYQMVKCENCPDLHPDGVAKKRVVAAVSMKWLVCPSCGTGEEIKFLASHLKTMQAGMLN